MGGSAPKYTGLNVINPIAAINAAGMMLDFIGEAKGGAAIEAAVVKIINTKIKSLAAGKMGYGTREVGDLIAAAV
jgi:3-isopropylmalate dehydrogenase